MAVVGADYKFVYVDVGAYGSEADSTVFRDSAFGQKLATNRLNLPVGAHILGQLLPYYFVADDAFPLHKHILKPYAPRNKEHLSTEQGHFNQRYNSMKLNANLKVIKILTLKKRMPYRLSRARRIVENAFGIMCARWGCLKTEMVMIPDRVQKVVMACCALHNFLVKSCVSYCPAGFSDKLNEDGTIEEGEWRKSIPTGSLFRANGSAPSAQGRPNQNAKEVRDAIKDYVNSDVGRLPWGKK